MWQIVGLKNNCIFACDIFAFMKINSTQNFGFYRYWSLVLVLCYLGDRYGWLHTMIKFIIYNV